MLQLWSSMLVRTFASQFRMLFRTHTRVVIFVLIAISAYLSCSSVPDSLSVNCSLNHATQINVETLANSRSLSIKTVSKLLTHYQSRATRPWTHYFIGIMFYVYMFCTCFISNNTSDTYPVTPHSRCSCKHGCNNCFTCRSHRCIEDQYCVDLWLPIAWYDSSILSVSMTFTHLS
jgi:hypothetical protein